MGVSTIPYLKSITKLVKYWCWTDESLTIGKIISEMCRLGQDFGLSRWEYYLCPGKAVVDSCRKLWWECY